MAPPSASAGHRDSARDHARALLILAGEVLSPLIVYYGARIVGADAWVALVVGAGVSLLVLVTGTILRRRVDGIVLLALGLLLVGTVVGYATSDARVMMARGSWLTAVVGLVVGASAFTSRPALYQGTLRLMPPHSAAEWRRTWVRSPDFRRLLRRMTLAFGIAFLVDAAARIVMAYTLPLDVVPVVANLLLVGMLTVVVLVGKARGRRVVSSGPRPSAVDVVGEESAREG